jgi:hypothetical protein
MTWQKGMVKESYSQETDREREREEEMIKGPEKRYILSGYIPSDLLLQPGPIS